MPLHVFTPAVEKIPSLSIPHLILVSNDTDSLLFSTTLTFNWPVGSWVSWLHGSRVMVHTLWPVAALYSMRCQRPITHAQ